MKNFLNLLRYFILFIVAFIFILVFPLSTIYRVTHANLFKHNFWIDVVKSADFTTVLLKNIPEEKRREIKNSPAFNRQKEKLNEFVNEEIIEKKLEPFLKKIMDYLVKKRDKLPKPVLIKREKNKLYYIILGFFTARSSAIPPQYRRIADTALKNKVMRFMPDILIAKRMILPRVKRDLNNIRNKIAYYDRQAKWAIFIPIILVILIIGLTLKPKKIFAWLGGVLIISFPIFIAYSIIVFFGLNTSQYIYEQLLGTPALRAFFNKSVISLDKFKSLFNKLVFKPLAIEAVLYLLLGLVFLFTSIYLKKRIDKKADANIEIVE